MANEKNGKSKLGGERPVATGLNYSLYTLACYLCQYAAILRRHAGQPGQR